MVRRMTSHATSDFTQRRTSGALRIPLSSLGRSGLLPSGLLALSLLVGCETEPVSNGSSDRASQPALTAEQAAFEARKRALPAEAGDPVADPAQALSQETDHRSQEVTQGWQLSVSADKDAFVLGEPVNVRISLQNVSADARDATALLQPEFRQITYRVTAPDGAESVFQPIAQFCTLPILARKTFAPGEKVEQELKLFAARGGWMFDAPGDYRISAEFNGPASARQLLSNTVHIRVTEGTAQEQKEAQKLMNGEAALLLQWERGDQLTQGLKVLEQVASEAPNTIHGFYAHFVLGNNLSQEFFNGKETRAAQPEAALAHLTAARDALYARFDAGMSTHVRETLHLQLIHTLKQLGRPQQAHEVAAAFAQRYAEDVHMAVSLETIRQAALN